MSNGEQGSRQELKSTDEQEICCLCDRPGVEGVERDGIRLYFCADHWYEGNAPNVREQGGMPIEEMIRRALEERSSRAAESESMKLKLPREMQALYEHADSYTRRWLDELTRIAVKEAMALPMLPWETMFRELTLQAIPVAQKLSDNKGPGPKKVITAYEEFLIETVTMFLNGEQDAAMARLHEAFERGVSAAEIKKA
jgi:hypothetical protein